MKRETIRQLILELIKKTKNDEIVWESYTPRDNEILSGEFILDKIYNTNIQEKSFKLYKYKFKDWRDEFEFEWQSSIRLELVDKIGNTEYEFEYDNSFNDLYNIVREQSSNVASLVNSFLGFKLEILEAYYGTPRATLDITEELKEKVMDNKLNILASNEIKGDPEPGIVKRLKIKYQFGTQIYENEVGEGKRLILP